MSQVQSSSSTGINFTPTIHYETYDLINPEQFELDGRAVLVTGASKGIGRATALSYARAGTSYIAIAARSGMEALATEMTEAATKAGKKTPKVLPLSIDVTSKESVQQAAKDIEQAFGRLDVLINNAGYMKKLAPIIEQDADDWWKVWEVNIKGPYLVTQALLPLMLKTQDSLKIVLNVASTGAHHLLPGGSGYQAIRLANWHC